MKPLSRRSFLTRSAQAAGVALAASAVRPSTWAQPLGANDAIRIAIIGMGNKGRAHLKQLLARKDVRVTVLCDLDQSLIAGGVKEMQAKGATPFTTTDCREVLKRNDVDAIIVATGNQWHALLAVWGCQAGKDVYVEKPMTHTVWEGRKIIEAAQKYRRIVQVGTQYRSEVGLAQGIDYIHSGQLGKLKYVHTVYYAPRGPIGRRMPWYPKDLNYDLFCGPSPVKPLERDKLHYDWHWSWDTGNGELGNNGVHILDIAMRIVKSPLPARRVMSLGGRFVHSDVADTPNTHLAVYDFPGAPVLYESRALTAKPDVKYMDQVGGMRVGVVAYCEGGHLSGLVGCAAYDTSGKVIKQFKGDGGGGHMENFLNAMRSRRAEDLAAPATVGHASASMCHYGNISLRVGEAASPAEIDQALGNVPAAAKAARAMQDHLKVHGVDLEKQKLTLGEWLDLEPESDKIVKVSSGNEAKLERARYLVHEAQRPPYAIPEQV